MTTTLVRAAFEQRLAAMTDTLPTQHENKAYTPEVGVAYQRCSLVRADPSDETMGGSSFIEQGFFQVSLMYPQGAGPGAAETRAQLVRAWFNKGSSLTSGGVKVRIIKTPKVAGGFADGDRWHVPITIRFQAQITN